MACALTVKSPPIADKNSLELKFRKSGNDNLMIGLIQPIGMTWPAF